MLRNLSASRTKLYFTQEKSFFGYHCSATILGSETVEWQIGQEAVTTSTVPVKQHEEEKPENNG